MARKRNKENSKLRMDNLVPFEDENPKSAFIEDSEFDVKHKDFDERYVDSVKEYNSSGISNHLECYTSLMPLGYEMIVRAFVKEPVVTDEGITVPNRQIIGIPTRAGKGYAEMITDPYGFKSKVIIVSVGKNVTEYVPGDVVYVKKQLKAVPMGSGNEVGVYIENSFLHPDSDLVEAPSDPSSEHFGYLMIFENDTLGKDKRGF